MLREKERGGFFMCKQGFDNQLYIEKQSAEIQKRINDLGGKL